MGNPFVPNSATFVNTEIGKVGSRVVDILNDGTIDFTAYGVNTIAEREYMPNIEITSRGKSRILVAVTDRRLRRISRLGLQRHIPGSMPTEMEGVERRVLVEVGVNKKFGGHEDLQAADPLMHLCEQIANLLVNIHFVVDDLTGLVAFPIADGENKSDVGHRPLYDAERWSTNRQFTGVINAHYQLTEGG